MKHKAEDFLDAVRKRYWNNPGRVEDVIANARAWERLRKVAGLPFLFVKRGRR
jgi:hypothetical protein